VVRLSYPYRPEAERQTPAEVERRAVRDAAVLLGVDEGELRVVASGRRIWRDAVTPASAEHRDWLAGWSASLAGLDHVRVTGAWLAGTGLASVVPHARSIARALTGSAHDTTMNHRKDSSNEHD
jgi:oxygen-dependent protoporphyrinogen oxidase